MNNLQAIISKSINNANVQFDKLGVIAGASANAMTDAYKTPRFEVYLQDDGRTSTVQRVDYSQGSLYLTNRELDIAIDGSGFIPVTTKEGKVAYTRSGSFKLDNEGTIIMPDGSVVGEGIQIPINAVKVIIDKDGSVKYMDKDNKIEKIGKIPLVKFADVESLEQGDFNKVYETEKSGAPVLISDTNSFRQYHLERSNFNTYDAVNDILRLNASITASTSIIKLTDTLYEQAINLRQ